MHLIDCLENEYGKILISKLIDKLEVQKYEKTNLEDLVEALKNFKIGHWPFNDKTVEEICRKPIHKWKNIFNDKIINFNEHNFEHIFNYVKHNLNTSADVVNLLPKLDEFIKMYAISIKNVSCFMPNCGKPIIKFSITEIKQWCIYFKIQVNKKVFLHECLAVIVRAVEISKNIKLRDAQIFTVSCFLLCETHLLSQMSTGEGKSIIVVILCIIKSLFGETVDVITSSVVLAKRDALIHKNIYDLFDISVSHNCDEDLEKRKSAYASQVIYGEAGGFERDILLDRFYNKNIFGDRSFQNVIADEVDSMLLDRGNNVLYLSHNIPDLDKLESLYVFIWVEISKQIVDHVFPDLESIKKNVFNDMHKKIQKNDLNFINSENQALLIWNDLIRLKVIDSNGVIKIFSTEIKKMLKNLEIKTYSCELNYLLQESINVKKNIQIPNYLYPFVERHLDTWVKNAFKAVKMKDGQDYIVDIDRSGSSLDLDPNIIIIDTDTGTDQVNSQWSECLHQFLQLKHKCKLSLQSLKAVFISNRSFFSSYEHLYGLTGTLGSKTERNLLKNIYSVGYVTIPTALKKSFNEYDQVLLDDENDWHQKILHTSIEIATSRSVLIICENINEAENLFSIFKKELKKIKLKLHLYTRDYEAFEIIEDDKVLDIGEVIIATNLAGRGTDIKCSDKLKKSGGLHVILTFLPSNIRVEQQAFGRSARNGDNGSGQLIFFENSYKDFLPDINKRLEYLIEIRDINEILRLEEIKRYYCDVIEVEERFFDKFRRKFNELESLLMHENKEIKEIIMETILDEWSFWLDKNSKKIENNYIGSEQVKKIDYDLESFLSQIFDSLIKDSKSVISFIQSPISILKLSKAYAKQNKYNIANDLINKIKSLEPDFSEFAYYYECFNLIKGFGSLKAQFNLEPKDVLIKNLELSLQKSEILFQNRLKREAMYASLIDGINKILYADFNTFVEINSYQKQKENMIGIYNLFIKSIKDILGNEITPQSFDYVNIDQTACQIVFDDMLDESFIILERSKKEILDEDLEDICQEFVINKDKFKNFLQKHPDLNETNTQLFVSEFREIKSREEFWNILKENAVLVNEQEFFMVDSNVNQNFEKFFKNFLSENNRNEIDVQLKQNEIYYNHEIFEIDKNQNVTPIKYITFDKKIVKEHFTEKEWKIAEKNNYFILNKKAEFDSKKIKILKFEKANSLIFKEFIPNIENEFSINIFNDLIYQGIIDNNGSLLSFNFNELKLDIYPSLLKNDILEVLTRCFRYNLELKRILKSQNNNQGLDPIKLDLIRLPHNYIINILIQKNIYSAAKVNSEKENLEDDVEDFYICKQLKDLVPFGDKLFEKEPLIKKFYTLKHLKKVEGENCDQLWKHLIEIKWILPTLNCEYFKINSDLNSTLQNSSNELSLKRTLHALRLIVEKKEFIKFISLTLNSSKGIKGLKLPDVNLKSLESIIDQAEHFKTIEELNIFKINGSSEILEIEEKRWTLKMIINCFAVVIIGIAQVCIGVLIELFSNGLATNVASALIGEGVGDIIFAIESAYSGYFSWKSYLEHKRLSLISTVLSMGVGMWFSKGSQVSRFGYKIGGNSLSKTCGFELFKKTSEASIKELEVNVSKLVLKRIGWKIYKGVTSGIANVAIDALIETFFSKVTSYIADMLVQNIESEIDKRNMDSMLLSLYKTYGPNKSKSYLKTWNNEILSETWIVQEICSVLSSIIGSVNSGLQSAIKKNRKSGNEVNGLQDFIMITDNLWKIIKNLVSFIAISTTVKRFLDSTENKIKEKISLESTFKIKDKFDIELNHNEFKCFKYEIKKDWKIILGRRLKNDIENQLLKPLLEKGAQKLIYSFKRGLKTTYETYKTKQLFKELDQEKKVYDNITNDPNIIEYRKLQAKDKFEKKLVILMGKTTDPKLYAAIIREGGPVDLVCIQAVASLLKTTIIIKTTGNDDQVFTPSNQELSHSKYQVILNLDHATGDEFCGHFSNYNNPNMESSNSKDNNCFFNAVLDGNSINNLNGQSLRELAAKYISDEKDPKVTQILNYNWNRYECSKGNFGGNNKNEKHKADKAERIQKIEANKSTPIALNSSVSIDKSDNIVKLNKKSIENYKEEIEGYFDKILEQLHGMTNESTGSSNSTIAGGKPKDCMRLDLQASRTKNEECNIYDVQINSHIKGKENPLYPKNDKPLRTSVFGVKVYRPENGKRFELTENEKAKIKNELWSALKNGSRLVIRHQT